MWIQIHSFRQASHCFLPGQSLLSVVEISKDQESVRQTEETLISLHKCAG